MQLVVNGQPQTQDEGLSLSVLLERLALEPRRVAVELNKLIVPRTRYAQTVLQENDVLEIVTLVGGG